MVAKTCNFWHLGKRWYTFSCYCTNIGVASLKGEDNFRLVPIQDQDDPGPLFPHLLIQKLD